MTDKLLPEGVSIRNPQKVFIGGAWVEPSSGKTITLINPNTEQPVSTRIWTGRLRLRERRSMTGLGR